MTTLEKTFAFTIGANVSCVDGQCGNLAKIVIDPKTLKVSGLIVEEGLLLKSARVFPVEMVDYADEEEIHLLLTDDDLKSFPTYEETSFERPQEGWSGYTYYEPGDILFPTYGAVHNIGVATVNEKIHQGVATGLEVVEKGTDIKNAEGTIGKLDNLATDMVSGEITHLIVRQGTIFSEQFKIPISWVKEVSNQGIIVASSNDELAQYWASETNQEGDKNMNNSNDESILTNETELASTITESLMNDSRTSDAVIEVINERGVVTLSGEVNSQETREAAEAITANHSGVVSVVNSLKLES